LNLIDFNTRVRAIGRGPLRLVTEPRRPPDPVPVTAALGPVVSPATMPAGVLTTRNDSRSRPPAMTDPLVVNMHDAARIHLDAAAHNPVAGQVYPGVPLDDMVTAMGFSTVGRQSWNRHCDPLNRSRSRPRRQPRRC